MSAAALRRLPPEPPPFETMAFEPMTLDWAPEAAAAPASSRLAQGGVAVVANARAGGVRRMGRARVERAVRAALGPDLLDLRWVEPAEMEAALADAVAARPRVLAVLGGDGTARTALDIAGGRVPVAPLPGGTLSRLSRAVYGRRSLKACLAALATGGAQRLPAGRIGERRFYAVCGFGPLMELDGLREDLRAGQGAGAAWARLNALRRRGFQDSLLWSVPGQERRAAAALVVALGPVDAAFGLAPPAARLTLEAAGTRLDGWPDLAGLPARAVLRRWRSRCGLTTRRGPRVEVAGPGGPVFGLLDGERCLLPEHFIIEFEPAAALVWGPPPRHSRSREGILWTA